MDNPLNFIGYFMFDSELGKSILEQGLIIKLEKNAVLDKEYSGGTVIVQSGFCRVYTLIANQEVTLRFVDENEVFISKHSSYSPISYSESIQVLEDSTIHCIDSVKWLFLKKKYPELDQIEKKIFDKEIFETNEANINFRTLSALQRYEKLLQETPKLVQKVPLHHLASYLGMSRETISRVRKMV